MRRGCRPTDVTRPLPKPLGIGAHVVERAARTRRNCRGDRDRSDRAPRSFTRHRRPVDATVTMETPPDSPSAGERRGFPATDLIDASTADGPRLRVS